VRQFFDQLQKPDPDQIEGLSPAIATEAITGSTDTFGFAMTEGGDCFTVPSIVPGIFIGPLPWLQKRADDPAYFKYYNSRYGAAESEADGWFTAACVPMICEDRVLTGLHGQYFVFVVSALGNAKDRNWDTNPNAQIPWKHSPSTASASHRLFVWRQG